MKKTGYITPENIKKYCKYEVWGLHNEKKVDIGDEKISICPFCSFHSYITTTLTSLFRCIVSAIAIISSLSGDVIIPVPSFILSPIRLDTPIL